MSATSTLKALDLLISGLTLVTETQKALQNVATRLQQAQAEGRDLTDEEVEEVRKQTDDALARLRNG